MTAADALHWASVVLNPYSRCACCGIPARILAAYWRLGWRLWGRSGLLHLDHIDPWQRETTGNVRLLCGLCNSVRGPALHTDEEVLQRVTNRYHRALQAAELWWLHSRPGRGGLSRRGRKHEESLLRSPALEDDGADAQDGARAPQERRDTD